jgi:hypothetical protein
MKPTGPEEMCRGDSVPHPPETTQVEPPLPRNNSLTNNTAVSRQKLLFLDVLKVFRIYDRIHE